MQARFLDHVCLPPTREKICFLDQVHSPPALPTGDEIDAAIVAVVSSVDWQVARDAMLVCPCALADNRRACFRRIWMSRLCYRPRVRARARRRQRHRGSGERAPPGDSGDPDGPPSRPRTDAGGRP
jgi:hypothetical protein